MAKSTSSFSADQITPDLVRRLIAAQFPQWAALPVRAAEPQGWDNRTFRLGEELSVRLPSAPGYVPQVEKEQRWLPWLAPRLPLPIPVPLALGRPGEGFPFPWSVYGWLDGGGVVSWAQEPRPGFRLRRGRPLPPSYGSSSSACRKPGSGGTHAQKEPEELCEDMALLVIAQCLHGNTAHAPLADGR